GVASKIFGSKALYDATFRIIAYAGATNLVSWIPVLGQIASFYGLYLMFIGLQEIHQLKPRQAGIVVMGIVGIVMLLLIFRLSVAPISLEPGN
ncbi:MAG: YIP1 family protein, partial [Pseudomonadota bacterium]